MALDATGPGAGLALFMPPDFEEVQRRVFVGVFGDAYTHVTRATGTKSLPGPLAQVLLRGSLAAMNLDNYVVCEKSDGTRHMLLVAPDMTYGCYLVGRSMNVSTWAGADEIARTIGSQALLDGELVARTGAGMGPAFMVFDTIVAGGKSVGARAHRDRMAAFERGVRAPLRCGLAAASGSRLGLLASLPILGKLFVAAAGAATVFSLMRTQADGSCVFSDGEQRSNKTDGLVFTPARCSYGGQFAARACGGAGGSEGELLLKWKDPSDQTVDFHVGLPLEPGLSAPLSASTDTSRLDALCAVTHLIVDDTTRRALAPCAGSSAIIECAYDTAASGWRLRHVRPERATPNHMRVVTQTLEALAERLTRADLLAAIATKEAAKAEAK